MYGQDDGSILLPEIDFGQCLAHHGGIGADDAFHEAGFLDFDLLQSEFSVVCPREDNAVDFLNALDARCHHLEQDAGRRPRIPVCREAPIGGYRVA